MPPFPHGVIRLARILLPINVVIFTGVGFCMHDVFWRVGDTLFDHGPGAYGFVWLVLHTVIGIELFVAFGVFEF